MDLSINNILKQLRTFLLDQWLVWFFVLTIGLKLLFMNTWILKVTWPVDQYQAGILMGFLSVAILFAPLFFVKKHKDIWVLGWAIVLSALLLADTIYFTYFGALPTAGLIDTLGQAKELGPSVSTLTHWWNLLYFADVALVIILWKPAHALVDKLKAKAKLGASGRLAALAATMILILVFWVGTLLIPKVSLARMVDRGYDTVSAAQYYGVIVSHLVDLTRYLEQETIHLSAKQKAVVVSWVKQNQPAQATDALTGVAKGKNVIIVQVESLGGFALNQTVNGHEVTPNLDALAKSSQYFPNDRFVIGAGHTSDTDFVVNSSYVPMDDSAVFVRYGQDNFTSLPKVLVANGYSAFAYHGYNRNFWNRSVAFASLGYQKFFASDNYPKGTVINMGLNDYDFLSKTADYIKVQPKPSLSYAITLSSHVPFATTDQTQGLGINESDYPYLVGGYLEDINYTDRAIGNFMAKLKAEGLYGDSVIIVYGDHTPVLPAFTTGTIKYDPTSAQEKEVPLLVKLPNETSGKVYKNQGTHLDIMPTILDLLGVKTNVLMFGQSLFATGASDLKSCDNQWAVFATTGNCNAMLTTEKAMAGQIIRYNLFNILPK